MYCWGFDGFAVLGGKVFGRKSKCFVLGGKFFSQQWTRGRECLFLLYIVNRLVYLQDMSSLYPINLVLVENKKNVKKITRHNMRCHNLIFLYSSRFFYKLHI